MKKDKRIIVYILYMVLGIGLFGLGLVKILDSFWSGMGGALIAVGVVRMIHGLRYGKDETYRENTEIAAKDERNRFIRNKAWAWAGYLFVLIAAVSTIVFRLLGQELLSVAAGFAVCVLVLLYWVSFLVLKKKY